MTQNSRRGQGDLYIIGLTGGIGTGKSTASAYLKVLGAPVWDADEASRAVVEPGREGWKALRREFGAEYFDSAGNLLRKKLAERIFSSDGDRETINRLLHPAILDEMQRWLARVRATGAALAVIEAPLLFESGVDRFADEVWVLSCGVDEQVRRVMGRGLTHEQAVDRVESQMSDRERRRLANRIIDTSGPVQDTQRQLKALYEEAQGEL